MINVAIAKRLLAILAAVLLPALSLLGCIGWQTIPPSEVEFSPPVEEKVEYLAIPPCELSARLFPSGFADDSFWSHAVGKWVLWSGEVTGIEPKLSPSRLNFHYPYDGGWSPLKVWSDLSVVVEFDDDESTSTLRDLSIGDEVYYRAKLVRQEPSLSPIGQRLILQDGQIIERNHLAARLGDLAYVSYEQIDHLLAAAERIDNVMNYFERRANVTSSVRWQLSSFATQLVNIELPHDPSLSGGDNSDVRQMSLSVVSNEAALAKSEIERNLAAALELLHDGDESVEVDPDDIHELMRTIERIKTYGISEDEVEYLEDIEEKDRRLGQPSVVGAFLTLVSSPFGIWVKIVAAVAHAAATVILDVQLHDVYEQMIVVCETYLGTSSAWLELIRNANVVTMSKIVTLG